MTSRPLTQVQHTAVSRAVWLIVAVATLATILIAVPLRYQMLLDDHYGYGAPLAAMDISLRAFAIYFVFWELLLALGAWSVGVLIAWRKGDDWFALLSAITLMLIGFVPPLLDGLIIANTAWTMPIVLLRVLGFTGLIVVFSLFPNGRFVPRWLRFVLIGWIVNLVIGLLFLPQGLADTAIMPHTNTSSDALWLVYRVAWFVPVLVAQWYRYRRVSTAVEQQQTKWVLWGFTIPVLISLFNAILLVGFPSLRTDPTLNTILTLTLGVLLLLSTLLIPLSLALAIFRYRLWQIDIILNRTLVYGGLTGLVTAVYILLVGGVGALVANQSGQIIGLVLATAILLAGLRPLRDRWQGAVNRYIPLPTAPPRTATMAENPHNEMIAPLRGLKLWLAWFSCLLAILLWGFIITAIIPYANVPLNEWLIYLSIPTFILIGTLIVIHRPGNRIGRLCLLIGWLWIPALFGIFQEAGLAPFNLENLFPYAIRITLTLMQINCLLIFVYLPLLFPDGRYLNKKWQRFGNGLALLLALPIILTLIQPGSMFDWAHGEQLTIANPLAINWPWLASLSHITLIYLWGIPTQLAVLMAIISLIVRWRRSDGQVRQQTKWVVYFLSTVVSTFMTIELIYWMLAAMPLKSQFVETAVFSVINAIYSPLALVTWLGLPLVIGLAILKHNLFDIDIIINRTLVYGGLSLGIVAVYVLVVGALSALFQAQGNYLFALLATGLIAVLFQPVRQRLQQAVNRLMFGDRDDPYAVLSKLGEQLQTTATPEAMLQSVVETIATTLKLPYVAIQLADEQGRLEGAATGKAIAGTVELPLLYQNETVGYLVVSPRSPGESFTEREQKLLADMAGQAGAMAYSVRLTAALQRSREKLVLAREEERRRIRRDLHDELGPTLASQTFALDAVLDLLETDPQAAAKLLQSLKAQNQETVADIRRLVYELRPPALDELGVVAALQAHVAQMNGNHTLAIHIQAQPDPLPPLPAAVEVAAYRISLEAITNVVRHAQARRCDVCLRVVTNGRSQLQIVITDNGMGLPSGLHLGVGLMSMRERAEELGGRYEMTAAPNGGTRVTAVLPLLTTQGTE